MPNRRDLKLDKYEISKFTYRELFNFCRQYPEKREKLKQLRSVGATRITGMPRGGGVSNPTERKALQAAKYSNDCELIEQCALEVGGIAYAWLIDGVTEGVSYETMNQIGYFRGVIPIGKNAYYTVRRQFFWLLAIKKGDV